MPGRVLGDEDVDSKMSWQRSDLENNGPKNLNSHVTPAVNGIAHEKLSLAGTKLNGQTPSHQPASDSLSPFRTTMEKPPSAAAMPQQSELPPEVEHITFGYQRVSTLVGRLAQETFNNLNEVIDALAETPAPAPPHLGGVGNHAAVNGGDLTAAAQRKMRMMKFAQDRRAQFIKLLVLTQWSRQSADVSKVIDLRAWLERERVYYDEASISLSEMRRSLAGAKIPNPDIDTALEALSTGKVSGMPDLGYIPPPPLSSQEMLKALRNINTLLSIRLNLHEELPPQLRSFNIESGRVTFTVPDEFELDLSIADEDPSSQLYFIDFHFAFWPSSQETIDPRLLDDVDRKCNELLGTTGLRGCYQFLHEMVLTHKINILRRQAFEMSREWWSESIKLEMLRRTLVVQYWLGRVGPRHWIEIGITSGKRKASRLTAGDEPTSEISVRWFVAGREVQDAPAISLQLHHLSMERILKSYICTHISRILSSIRQRLFQIRSYGGQALAIELKASKTEPSDCQLKVELTASTSITIAIEPVSGKFALIPTSPLFARFEAELNNMRDPAADAHRLIFNLRCLSVVNEVESSARAIGLQPWKTLSLKQDDVRRVFSRDTLRVLYLRRKEWNTNWILAMSVGPSGEAWWIMEILDAPIGWRVGHFQRLPVVSASGRAIPLTDTFLSRLWTKAAGIIAQFANVRALASMGVRHAFRAERVVTAEASRSLPTLLIDFTSLLSSNSNGSNDDGGSSGDQERKPWAKRALSVVCQDASLGSGEVTLLVKGMLQRPEPTLKLTSTGPDDAITMNPETGAFTFTIPVALGQPMIQRLRNHLQRMERMLEVVKVVRSFRLPCDSVTLGRIEVTYAAEPRLTAIIEFPGSLAAGDTAPPITIDFARGNPHLRIRSFLNAMLADKDGLANVLLHLAFTLPVLLAFDEMEARSSRTRAVGPASSANTNTVTASAPISNSVTAPTNAGAGNSASANNIQPILPDADIGPVILTRGVAWFRLEYEHPQCTFDIRLRQRRDKVRWAVSASLLSSSPSFSSTLYSAAPSSSSSNPFSTPASTHVTSTSPFSSSFIEPLRAFMRQRGRGWISLGNCIAADIEGLATVVRKVDALVRQHAAAVPVSAPSLPPPQPAPLTPPHRPLPAQQEQQQQQQQQQQPQRPPLDRHPPHRAQHLKAQQQLQQQQQQQRQQQHLQVHHPQPSPASHHPTPPSLPLPLPPQ